MANAEFPVGSPRSRASRPSRSQNQDDRSIRQAGGEDLDTRRDRPPRLLPVSDAAAAYRLVYGRLDALIRGRAEVAELTVPACPAWNVRQTVAHLAGLALDIVSLNMEEKAADSWTQAQVDRLGGHSIDELLDLWGQIRNEVAAGEANAAASAADLENARLSLIAQLADDYIQLRSLDRDSAILDQTVTAYARAQSLTEQRHNAGIAPGLDVSQAQTQLNAARSQAAQTLAQRALMEHAIAALLGVSASTFSIKPEIVDIKLPQIPSGVPATLLQRRPDIAGAQRRMMAANANIGVARAAYFPTLTLGAQGGFQSTSFSNWLSAPSSFWAIGPNALLSVFDGGLRRAQVAQARAQFDASAANYRSTVVGAFQQVEDSLATLNHYHDAAVDEKAAVDAAQRTLDFSMALYVKGATDYLTVVTSQTAVLQTQLEALNLDTLQLRASVDLIRALGGGWESSDAPHAILSGIHETPQAHGN